MKKLRAVIIDDEQLARDLLKVYASEIADLEIVAECGDGFEALKAIQEHTPDLIFLDIQMPKITGFELLEVLSDPPAIIFITAYDQFAVKAFEHNAADYLLKPVARERFIAAVKKVQGTLHKNQTVKESLEGVKKAAGEMKETLDRIVVRTGSKVKVLGLDAVFYLQAEDDYVSIHTTGEKFLKQQTMKFFEDHLPVNFLRVHRSYIVNIDQVLQIELWEKDTHRIVLKNKEIIPVSRSGYTMLRKKLQI
jgi:two-component system, LytTR family, response regulator